VDAGIGQQIGDHLVQTHLVAAHHDRTARVREGDGAVRLHRPSVGHCVVDQCDQFDRLPLQGPALVETSQQEQVVDEHTHAGGLVLDAAHGQCQLLGIVGGAAPEQLGVAADRREGGAQLMGGVGHEAAQPLLQLVALGEGLLDAIDHRVERHAQVAVLGAGVGHGVAMGERQDHGHGGHDLHRDEATERVLDVG
jgi:hypothetical protein